MGATRDVALNELPLRGISINAETSDNTVAITVVPSDSGIIFINKETSGTVTYTLPAVALGKGKMFWFYEGTAKQLDIYCATSSIIGDATGQTATGTAVLGTCAMVVGDGTYYYLFEISGAWSVA